MTTLITSLSGAGYQEGFERGWRLRPSRVNAPWVLLSSDGKEPSDKEMEQYAKDKLKQTEDLKKYPERSPLGVKTMVQPGSLDCSRIKMSVGCSCSRQRERIKR